VSSFPLVLIHHAGGAANVFAPLQRALPTSVRPMALELPGRGRRWREQPLTDARDAIADLARQIGDLGPEIAILGHSLGAYLGLGLAAFLERQNRVKCTTLFASANAGPRAAALPFDKPALECSDDEIIEIAMLSGGGVPKEVLNNQQLRSRTAALLRADFSLSQTFLAGRL
jgi:surfactin synthase thioesterase subunit